MAEMVESVLSNIFDDSSRHDLEFCTIYFQAGKKLLDFEKKSNAEYLNRYYEIFRKHFTFLFESRLHPDHPDYDSETVKLLKDSLYYRIVYVLRNSPILSSAVAFHFKNVLKEDLSYFKKLIKNQKIKICSVGGGAASDIVAVVKVLDSIAITMDKQLDFRITVIDSIATWKNTCFTVLSCLKNFSGATWKINFVQADISDKNTYPKEVIESIKDADIVLMVMFLYNFVSENLDGKETVKNVSEVMKNGSMLFLLDISLIEHIRSCFGLSGETENLHLIYEILSDHHILDEAARYNSYIRYKKLFKLLILHNYLQLFVRAWIKTSTREIYRMELQHRFKKEVERCDPRQTLLDHGPFESWLITYTNKKRKAGWNESFINELLREKRQNRLFFQYELNKSEEKLETARKQLIDENKKDKEGKQHGTDEIDEDAWEKYVVRKKKYANLKLSVYKNIIYDANIPDNF